MAAHNSVTLRSACSNPSGPEQSMLLYSMLLEHYLPHLRILGNSMFTHITQWSSELQSTEYSDSYVFALCCDIIMQHEPMKCALFKLIL